MKKGKVLKITVFSLLLLLIALQFIPTSKNSQEETPETDFIKTYQPEAAISAILVASCYDCHSNSTQYPWYSHIQPFAYLMEQHIVEGKEELNFSEFTQYSNRMKRRKFQSIINELKNESMPLPSYERINEKGALSAEQRKQLIEWFESLEIR